MPTTDLHRQLESAMARAPDSAARSRYVRGVAGPIVVFLPLAWLAVATTSSRIDVPPDGAAGANAAALMTKIDPNQAPWWELTTLPRVGEKTAKKITAFRDAYRAKHGPQAVAFRTPQDLTQVKGIGPQTVARWRPMLVFPNDPDHATARR